jgi:hypothetical protein
VLACWTAAIETVTTTAILRSGRETGTATVVSAGVRAIRMVEAPIASRAKSAASARSCDDVLARIVGTPSAVTTLIARTAGFASMNSCSQSSRSTGLRPRVPKSSAMA